MPDKEAVIWLNNKAEIVEKLTQTKPNVKIMLQWAAIVIGDYTEASKKIRKTLQLD